MKKIQALSHDNFISISWDVQWEKEKLLQKKNFLAQKFI